MAARRSGSAMRKKLVVVGDSYCGKTCLLMMFKDNTFIENSLATIFENDVKKINIDGRQIELHLWDTAGQENYDRIRPMSYPNTDVFLLCFSIAERSSFSNLTNVWVKELKQYCPDVPVVLVGNKKDLRGDATVARNLARRGQVPVAYEEGAMLAKQIGAVGYVECSALTNVGIREVFETATRATLVEKTMESLREKRRGKKRVCVII